MNLRHAGFYPDPHDSNRMLYWNGTAWDATVQPPETIEAIAVELGVPANGLLKAVERLRLPFEPNDKPLTTASRLAQVHLEEAKFDLGLLSAAEEQRYIQRKKALHQGNMRAIAALAGVALAVVGLLVLFRRELAQAPQFLVETTLGILELLWWLINTTAARVLMVLVLLWVAAIAVFWNYHNPRSLRRGRGR